MGRILVVRPSNRKNQTCENPVRTNRSDCDSFKGQNPKVATQEIILLGN